MVVPCLFSQCLAVLPTDALNVRCDVTGYNYCPRHHNNVSMFKSTIACLIAEFGGFNNLKLVLNRCKCPVTDLLRDPLLHKACRSTVDAVRKIHLLLDFDGTWLNAQNRNGVAPIHIAATRNDVRIICVFLSNQQCDVNIRTLKRLTPLHVAANKGKYHVVKELLRHQQIDCNAIDVNGDTAAHHAAANGYHDILFLIAERGRHWCSTLKNKSYRTADQESKVNTELLNVSRTGTTFEMQAVLKKHPRITSHQSSGENPLHLACRSNICELSKAKLLLQKYPELINEGNAFGQRPIHISTSRRHEVLTQLLLTQENIDVNCQDDSGQSALHVAARLDVTSVFNLLFDHPCIDVNLQDHHGNTPAHVAIMNNHAHLYQELSRQAQFRKDLRNDSGMTIGGAYYYYAVRGIFSRLVYDNRTSTGPERHSARDNSPMLFLIGIVLLLITYLCVDYFLFAAIHVCVCWWLLCTRYV